MKICFVLPCYSRKPSGGYKIVFEYANRLTARGYEVTILHLNDDALQGRRLPEPVRRAAANLFTRLFPRWIRLDPRVRKLSNLRRGFEKELRDVDAVFATGIQTVEPVRKLFPNTRKLYLIQGFENWNCSDAYVYGTYALGFTNIAVSAWLKELVDAHSTQPAVLIRNPIDLDVYRQRVPQAQRRPFTVGLLYHETPCKGLAYALAALRLLKARYPQLEAEMFGIYPRPEGLEDWIRYTHNASAAETVEIYNRVQLFLCASVEEGFGLTGLEAMACGACLVSTDYQGVKEYAVDGVNALLSPVKDAQALATHAAQALEDAALRERLVANGLDTVQAYSWDKALERMEQVLNDPA